MAKKAETKLEKSLAKRCEKLNITTKSEEAAKQAILNKLEKEDITGMEGEDMDTLLDMLESFVGEESEEEDDDTGSSETETDEDLDELSEEEDEEEPEEEEEKPKKTSKKSAPAAKEPTPKTKKVEEPEEEDEEEEEEKPAKKSSKKATAKKEEKKSAPAAKAASRGIKLNPQKNVEDRKYFDPLKKLFPEDKFIYAWIANNGVTIKYKGTNSNRSILLIENVVLRPDETITANVYFFTFAKDASPLEEKGFDIETSWNNQPFIKAMDFEEAIELFTEFKKDIYAFVESIDSRLGKNRAKMEENLEKGKKTAKEPTPKTKKVEEPEEEDEEEEEEKPAKKSGTLKSSKKPSKKVEEPEEEDEEEEEKPKKKAPVKKSGKKK